MGIADEDIVRVRETTDLVSLIGEQVTLKRVGQRFVGLCPFHQEKTPSFGVNPTMGFWHCFGCSKSGDAITWVRETEHLDFVEAIERLAQRAGITLRYDDRSQQKDRSRQGRLREVCGAAIEYYHRLLLEAPEGGPARKYLRGRGFDGDAARRFLLGWSPDGWDGLARWLQQERKFSRDDIVGAGLAFVNKANRLQDQFRARLMFPIHDSRGEPAGFGGRALTDDGPKYKNSPETPIYQKSRLLYGLHWAKESIVAKGDVIICEGYTDVMAFALAGAPNAIATCGTALADEHVRALKNLTRSVTLAYDDDTAGRGAAEQWYRWEQQYELSVRVADLPLGQDPGDLWPDGEDQLLSAIEKRKPLMEFRIDRALEACDLTTADGKGRAAQLAAVVIAEHPEQLKRDSYAMGLGGTLDVHVPNFRAAIEEARRVRDRPKSGRGSVPNADEPPPEETAPSPVEPTAVDRREADLLKWVIHEPELVMDWIDQALLLDPVAREAYDLLGSAHDFHEAVASSSGAVRELLERLAVEEPMDEEDERSTLRARLLTINVEPAAKRLIDALLREGDHRGSAVKAELSALAHDRDVGDWEHAQDVAERLVVWVVGEARTSAQSMPEVVEQGA